MSLALSVLTLTSNWVSRLFLSGTDEIGIKKMRSIFFQRAKSSGVPVTQPAGSGSKTNKFISTDLIQQNRLQTKIIPSNYCKFKKQALHLFTRFKLIFYLVTL